MKLALAGEFVPDAVNVGGGVVGEEVAPWLDLVRKLGLLVGALAPALPASLNVEVLGELASEDVEILKLSAMRGLFSAVIEDQVTFVNAPALAAERGVEAVLTSETESPNHRSVVDVRAVAADGSVVNVSGTLSGPQLVEKIVQINGRNLDLRAEGINLILNYGDQPGALARSAPRSVRLRSTSWRPSCRRTPTVRERRSCCAWTARCRPTCSARSARPSARPRWNWWICREARRHCR